MLYFIYVKWEFYSRFCLDNIYKNIYFSKLW